MQTKIGFIGQGWIGNSYANNFEKRGYEVIRYGLEPQYKVNKDKIKECDIVFIAVPTPTIKGKFDDSVVDEALSLVGQGKVAVIKSTILPGTTEKFQNKYKDIVVLHSPEFLTEVSAQYDADHPSRNVIGYVDEIGERASHSVMRVLPDCPYRSIVPARTAELIKYCNNVWFYTKVIMANLFYDLSVKLDVDYQMVKEAMGFDPRIGFTHLDPIHKSGRGAGGHCFIKDFAAFKSVYDKSGDKLGSQLLKAIEDKNIELLQASNKDLNILEQVYDRQ